MVAPTGDLDLSKGLKDRVDVVIVLSRNRVAKAADFFDDGIDCHASASLQRLKPRPGSARRSRTQSSAAGVRRIGPLLGRSAVFGQSCVSGAGRFAG